MYLTDNALSLELSKLKERLSDKDISELTIASIELICNLATEVQLRREQARRYSESHRCVRACDRHMGQTMKMNFTATAVHFVSYCPLCEEESKLPKCDCSLYVRGSSTGGHMCPLHGQVM